MATPNVKLWSLNERLICVLVKWKRDLGAPCFCYDQDTKVAAKRLTFTCCSRELQAQLESLRQLSLNDNSNGHGGGGGGGGGGGNHPDSDGGLNDSFYGAPITR